MVGVAAQLGSGRRVVRYPFPMNMATSREEEKTMSFEEIVEAHMDRLGMTREEAEIRAWFAKATEEDVTDAHGNRMLLD